MEIAIAVLTCIGGVIPLVTDVVKHECSHWLLKMAKKKRCLLLRRHLFFLEWNIEFPIFSIVTLILLNYNMINFLIVIGLLHPINASLHMYTDTFV